MEETSKNTQRGSEAITQVAFWGTLFQAFLLLAVSGVVYYLTFSAAYASLNELGKVLVLIVRISAGVLAAMNIASMVFTYKRQQEIGYGLTYFSVVVFMLAFVFLLQGRMVFLSFFTLVVSALGIFWLCSPKSRRFYIIVTVITLALAWAVELINPPWRLTYSGVQVGPIAAIVFAAILIAFAVRQAWGGNIRVRIITSFVAIALISVAVVGTVVYMSYRNQIRADMRQRLLNIISITALQQDGNLFATIQTPADMQGEAYQKMQAVNHAILATDLDLAYIFSVRVDETGKMVFVVDSGLEEGYEPVEVGVVYDDPSVLLAENAISLDRSIVEQDFYTDIYGTFLSAYAPIYKSDGSRAGIVGVDIFADKVLEKEQSVLILILGTTFGTMLIVTLLGLWLGNLFVNPIINLSAVAKTIASGDLNARATIETTDEVGDLANNFNFMASQLQETLQGLEQRITERTQSLELAAEVGRSVSQVREISVMLKDAAELIRSRFDLYYVQVYLLNPSRTELVLQAGTGSVGAELVSRGHRLTLNTGSLNGRAAVEKRAIIVADTASSLGFRPNALLPDTRSEMAVPLLVGDQVVGVLDLQSSIPGALNEEILSAFNALAGQLAVAIQNASLLAETQRARAEVEAQARRLTRAGWDTYLDALHQSEQFGYVFEQNEVVPLEESQAPASENALSVPISVTGEQLGKLVVDIEQSKLTSNHTQLINLVADQVSRQLENLRLLETAERYRTEAEESARRLTREGWEAYFKAKTGQSLGYYYDTKAVKPVEPEIKAEENVAASLPIKVREETIGQLAIMGDDPIDQDGREIANIIADRLSQHIESLRLLEETQLGQLELDKRARQLAAVSEISTISSRELDIQKMLATVVHMTQRQFGLYHAHVFTYNESSQALEIVACGWKEGDEHEGTHGTTVIPLAAEQSLVARAARSRQAVVVNDVRSDPGWLPNPLLPDTASELAVPLVIGDQVLGVMDVQSDRLNAFGEEDVSIQSTLASQVATALQNARSFARAQRQAEREAMLNAISQKIQSATSVEAVLQIAARELGHALGAPRTIAQLSMKDK